MDAIYPVGKYQEPTSYSENQIQNWIKDIEELPSKLRQVVSNLSENDLNKSYREGGWNIAQIVHHIADSHINSYTRFKLAKSADTPSILPYDENIWANFSDANNKDISSSLALIEGLHKRWVEFLNSFEEKDWNKAYYHPEHKREFTLKEALSQYSWHSLHHLGQIQNALKLG